MNSKTALQTFAEYERFAQTKVANGTFSRHTDCYSACPYYNEHSQNVGGFSVCLCESCAWERLQRPETAGTVPETGISVTSQDIDAFGDTVARFFSAVQSADGRPETTETTETDQVRLRPLWYFRQIQATRRTRLLKTGDQIVFDGKGQYFRPRTTTLPFVKGNGIWQSDDMRRVDYGDLQSLNQIR